MNHPGFCLQKGDKVGVTSDSNTREGTYSKPSEKARGGNVVSVQEGGGKEGFLEERAFELDPPEWLGRHRAHGHEERRHSCGNC